MTLSSPTLRSSGLADRRGGRCGKLPRIGKEGRAVPQLLDDARGIDLRLRRRLGSRRQENLGDPIFLLALGGLEPVDDRLHFLFADIDERLDPTALKAGPGHLAVDLPFDRARRRSLRMKEFGDRKSTRL